MVKIITLAYNRPDFIELQLNSLKKWVTDFEYIVYDNCPDNLIKDECDRLGITCIPVKIFSADPSWCVGLSLNKMWETLQHEKGIVVYIDSDMFLVGQLPSMQDYDFAFVPQERKDLYYPWTGLMLFNMDTLPNPEELQWQIDYSVGGDVGGINHHYLLENRPRVLELEMWTLIDDGKYSFNGADTDKDRSCGEMEKLAQKYDFPHPYSFDIFRARDKTFVLHYKSASNYPEFYTPEYNRLKTEAIKKLL